MLWIEAEIARERVNGRLATEAILLHGVVVSVLSPDGKGVKNLNKMLRDLIDGR